MSVETITPQQFMQQYLKDSSVELIDVRTPVEFREVHAEMARLVSLDQLDPQSLLAARNGNRSQPIYFICRSGSRAARACEKMSSSGFNNAISLEGGTDAWASAGLPVVRGKKAISLERQVRIAAGSLVLIGVILGWFVHWAFLGVSAFVGAGLAVSGITDFCGMGMLLAKMPWNRG